MNRKHLQAAGARKLMALLAMILLTLCMLLAIPTGVASADSSDAGCGSQQAALDAVNADIDAHNAKPHVFTVPQQQAAADAYNAEKAQLEARGSVAQTNLRSCVAAFKQLADGGTLPKPSQSRIDGINAGKAKLPENYAPPSPTPRTPSGAPSVAQEMRPLFKEIRETKKWPDDLVLQNKPKGNVGDPDPARNGAPIPGMKSDPSRPAVVVDHIVPLAQMMYMPGFLKLPAEQMYMVANAPLNLQWMSAYGNAAKSSASVARIGGADPKWVEEQLALEESTNKKLQDLINQLLAARPPGS